MAIVIDGSLGVSAVQDGIISESKLATGAVTDTKLTLTPNSQEIKDALNATGSAPIYACRAWVNFIGTGTVTIQASGNVSSVVDNGTGNYTVIFTTPMSDANYAVAFDSDAPNVSTLLTDLTGINRTTTYIQIYARKATSSTNVTGTSYDPNLITVAIFR